MSERSYKLVQQWLQQSALDGDELAQLVADKPYFSAAQLLLLNRLDAHSENWAAQKSRAALHVYNPIQLEERETFDFPFELFDEKQEEPVESFEEIASEPVSVEEKEIETFAATDEAPTNAEQEFIKVTPTESFPENSTPLAQKENETFENTFKPETAHVNEVENITENTSENSAAVLNKAEAEIETENKEQAFEEPLVKLPSFDLKGPVNAIAGDITFEPFHTVDYFASQGIKLSQTEAGNDRFGRQVKSFTEWLKTMKKLPATAITQNTDGAGESKVANLAAHSLQNADVVTESMAEVWLKQGNIQKASEVYNKLSLQNPSKKAYFAAKIESLKKPS